MPVFAHTVPVSKAASAEQIIADGCRLHLALLDKKNVSDSFDAAECAFGSDSHLVIAAAHMKMKAKVDESPPVHRF